MCLSELRQKDVISIPDGRSLGRVMDLEFCPMTGTIQAIIVPGEFHLLQSLRGEKTGVAIPWENIQKIGSDAVLVDICMSELT